MDNKKNSLRNIVSSDYKYHGAILDLRVDNVKFPSGKIKPREVVEHKDAVAVLAINSNGKIILVNQYRHAINEDTLEIPAGLIDDGERPIDAAIRELREEIGFLPSRIQLIAEYHSSPGFCTEKIYIYFADNLVPSKLPQDEDEYIKVFEFTSEEFKQLIDNGTIADGKTLIAYYLYASKKFD